MQDPIRYPIDDLLVQPAADDPVFTDRPSPSRDFNIQMDCVVDLLMVWDFCSSFGRMLHLWPFSLEDFENAICHKDSNLILIVETHSALLRLLIKDNSECFSALPKRSQKLKVQCNIFFHHYGSLRIKSLKSWIFQSAIYMISLICYELLWVMHLSCLTY